ncbi:MAG: TetR family transcriptional regulator [Xenococcaceae cyanobacterium]
MKSDHNPLRRQPQQKRSQERVEKILDAAAVVFDEVGFEAATTHAIAARADTAVGSLYQFFPDKLAIFNALELRHVDRVYVMWDKLLRPEIVQLPFPDFIHRTIIHVQQLFEQPTSRIIFVQFFTSPTIFKNIDDSFTQEAIQFMAKLLKMRNPALADRRSEILAEICVNATNALILLALRKNKLHDREIIQEIEALMRAYLEPDIGDEAIANNSTNLLPKLAEVYQLNHRQRLILKYAIDNGELTIDNCKILLFGVSRRTLQRDISKMVKQNLLLPQGNTNSRHYFLNLAAVNL